MGTPKQGNKKSEEEKDLGGRRGAHTETIRRNGFQKKNSGLS